MGRRSNLTLCLVAIWLLQVASCQAAEPSASPPATPTAPPTARELASPSPSRQPPGVKPICFAPTEISPFAFTPDGAAILVRAASGVQIFSLETGAEEDRLDAPRNIIVAALSPDGQSLAWSLDDNSIEWVRLSDHTVMRTLTAHPDPVLHLRFSPSGDRLYSASHDGWVRVWDSQGNLLPSIEAGGEVVGFGVSPDGAVLATIPSDGPVQLWDLAANARLSELGGSGGYDTSDAVFSPDGRYMAADLVTGLFLWNLAESELVWNGVKNSMAIAYSPDGQHLAYSDIDDDNKIILASPDGEEIMRILGAMQGPVWEMFFSPDGSRLAATDGAEIRVWRVEDGMLQDVGKATCP